MEKNELKPCPFCGGEAEIVEALNPWVRCKPCYATIVTPFGHSIYKKQIEEITKLWNTRPAADNGLKALDSDTRNKITTIRNILIQQLKSVDSEYEEVLGWRIVALDIVLGNKFGVPDNGLVEISLQNLKDILRCSYLMKTMNEAQQKYADDLMKDICKILGTKPPKPVEWPPEMKVEGSVACQFLAKKHNKCRELCIQAWERANG